MPSNKPAEPRVLGIPTTVDTISICETHWNELMAALDFRGLGRFVRMPPEQLAQYPVNPIMAASTALAMAGVHTVGIVHIRACQGCPVCAMQSVVTYVADQIAAQHAEAN